MKTVFRKKFTELLHIFGRVVELRDKRYADQYRKAESAQLLSVFLNQRIPHTCHGFMFG